MAGQMHLQEEAEEHAMFPVPAQTAAQWRRLYNQRMANVDNAATLEQKDEARLITGGAYFVHRAGELLGIGWLEGNTLLAMASLQPGAGEAVCRAIQSLIPGQPMTLEVASTNQRAISLYQRMGLLKVEELSCWHRVK